MVRWRLVKLRNLQLKIQKLVHRSSESSHFDNVCKSETLPKTQTVMKSHMVKDLGTGERMRVWSRNLIIEEQPL